MQRSLPELEMLTLARSFCSLQGEFCQAMDSFTTVSHVGMCEETDAPVTCKGEACLSPGALDKRGKDGRQVPRSAPGCLMVGRYFILWAR